MNHTIDALAVVITGLMVGVELGVAVFFNPFIGRLPDDAFSAARRRSGRVLGSMMPFWYATTLLLLALAAFDGWGEPSASPESAVLVDRHRSRYSGCRSTEDRRSPRNRLKVREHPGGPRRRTRQHRRYAPANLHAPATLRRGVRRSR
jgi:hypothetical protein